MKSWSDSHWCLSLRTPVGPFVKEAINLKFQWWLAQGSPEAADRYLKGRRASVSLVIKAKGLDVGLKEILAVQLSYDSVTGGTAKPRLYSEEKCWP